MCRLVYPILLDRDQTKDVVQDVYLSLWKNRKSLKIHTSYKAYIYRACTLRALDEIRKRKTKSHTIERLKERDPKSHNPTEEQMDRNEMQSIISNAIQSLPDTTREIFILKRYGALKNKEIGMQLNISIKTVESHVTKALKSLKLQLQPYLDYPLIFLLIHLLTTLYQPF